MAQILRVRAACCDITAVRYSPPPARPPNSTRSTGNAVLGVDIYRLLVLDTVYGRAARLRDEGAGLWWWSGGSRSDERHNTLYIHKCEWSSVPGFLVLHSTHIPLPYHKSRMKRLSAAGAQTHMNALMTRSNEHTTDKKQGAAAAMRAQADTYWKVPHKLNCGWWCGGRGPRAPQDLRRKCV